MIYLDINNNLINIIINVDLLTFGNHYQFY